jgi:hypothetical protein
MLAEACQMTCQWIDNYPVLPINSYIGNDDGELEMSPIKSEKDILSADWVRANMAYEPETGTFLWKVRGYGRMMGKPLGTKVWPGYIAMKVNGTRHYAHRVAWLYVHGEWPKGHIDHIDGNKANNAISNLRVATPAQNAARRKTTRNIAPSRGVFPHGAGFVARVHFGGKRHYLGYFSTAAAAKAAYEAKAAEIHGEFAHVEGSTWDREVADAVERSPHRDWLLVATPGFGEHTHG